MTGKTHILGGALAGELAALAVGNTSPTVAAVLIGGSIAGSLLPDIDHVNSKVSRSSIVAQATSYAVSGVTRHRGFIHTPVFILSSVVLLSGASVFGLPHGWLLTLALALGMLSHLILDTLNPTGIMWLWPLKKKRWHLLSIKTNSPIEWLVMLALAVIVLCLTATYLPDAARSVWERLPF